MSCLWPVALEGGSGSGGTPPTASVNAISNQTAPGTVTLGLTIPGGETPSAYAWEANGSTAGISDPTAAAPTFTFTQPITFTVSCTPTINGGPVIADPASFRLGDGDVLPIRPGATGTSVATT